MLTIIMDSVLITISSRKMKLSRKDKMDIYSLDRTSESTKSPSIQRCIFGEY